MGHDIKTFKQATAMLHDVWHEAAPFFASIETWLMVAAACATVAGAWLAVMGQAWSLLPFGLAAGYVAARVVLHLKRIVSWPFI